DLRTRRARSFNRGRSAGRHSVRAVRPPGRQPGLALRPASAGSPRLLLHANSVRTLDKAVIKEIFFTEQIGSVSMEALVPHILATCRPPTAAAAPAPPSAACGRGAAAARRCCRWG
uniref:Vesicle-fusing ATPase n=1 Tax=Macrostomum lignano TaxID=282301 RepID=A0A1I8HHC2_9PLAT